MTCSRDDAIQAEDVAVEIRSWDDAYQFYKRYRQCHDGSIAEGMDGQVYLLWADHWDQLPRMLHLFKKDDGFKRFIWPLIGAETFSLDDFMRTLAHAQTNCPREAKEFCAAVEESAPVP